MKSSKVVARWMFLTSSIAAVLLFAASARAATIWTDWTSDTIGSPGSASGTLNAVGVSYSGEVIAAVLNGTSNIWAPNSSFTGGTVTTSPSVVGDDIRLRGAFTGANTITFASPVENPVFAIWSLGAPGTGASFTFAATPTLQAGGPNSLFGGSSITVLGNVVGGNEGNGVVQFGGTFSAISWTDTFDNDSYAFSVGTNGPAPSPVPEPTSLILAGSGLPSAHAGIRGEGGIFCDFPREIAHSRMTDLNRVLVASHRELASGAPRTRSSTTRTHQIAKVPIAINESPSRSPF